MGFNGASHLLATLWEWEGAPTVYFSCRDFGAKIQKIKKVLERFFGNGPFYSVLLGLRPEGGRGRR